MKIHFFSVVVGLLALLPGCVRVSSAPALPTAMPTAVIPIAIEATLPPAPATATTPPTTIPTPTNLPPTETPVFAVAASAVPIETASLELVETASLELVETASPELVATASLELVATAVPSPPVFTTSEIGYSAAGRPLTDYQFGSGPTQIVFIGGIHGGYEWNTILLAYDMIDYFSANPDLIPADVTLHIMPTANPDGQYLVTAQETRFTPQDVAADSLPGRINSRGVDLNRNWDCNWTADALWRNQPTNGGSQPFSEPETRALRNFLLELNPVAVIFWHSAANGVYAAGCPELYTPSMNLATIYGRAANYPVYETFTSYQVTGDAGDWLALQGIASVSVELLNHEETDWVKNVAGVTAVLRQYTQINQ